MADALVLENVISNALTENFKNDERLKNIDKPESKIIETYENLAGETMKLTDVTKQVIDLCMTLIKKNDDNVNRVMEIKNPVNQISNTTNNNVTNYQSPVDKVNNIYKTNRNTNSNGLKTSTILNSIKDGVSKNINGFLGREVPFYNSIKSSFGALGKILSSKNRAEPTSPIGIGNVSKFFNSPVEDTPTGLFGKNNDSEVGISKRALAENKVLRYSTVGVAVGWLAKQLKGVGGKGDGLGMKDLIMGNAISGMGGKIFGVLGSALGLIFRPIKSLLGGMGGKLLPVLGKAAPVLGFMWNLLHAKSADKTSGKDAKDVTFADTTISNFSQGVLGNTGTGTNSERLKNSLMQGTSWASFGAMAGGPIGAIVGGSLGLIGGYIGGDKIAGKLIEAKDKLVSSFTGTEMASRDLSKSYAKSDESLNKTTESLDKFNKKVKEAPTIWDMFLDKLRNWGLLPPKPSDSGGVPSGASPGGFTGDLKTSVTGDANKYNYSFDFDKFREQLKSQGIKDNEVDRRVNTARDLWNSATKLKESGQIPNLNMELMMSQAMHETGNFRSKAMDALHNPFGTKFSSSPALRALQIDGATLTNNVEGGKSKYAGFANYEDAVKWWAIRTAKLDKSSTTAFANSLKKSGYYTDSVYNYLRGLNAPLSRGLISKELKNTPSDYYANQPTTQTKTEQKPVANKTVKSENLSETVAKQKEKEREANNEQRENVKTMAQATVEAKEIAENKNKTSAEITFAGKPSNNNFWISNSIMKTFFGGTVGGEANATVV